MLARRILLRLLQAVPTLVGVAVLVFVLVRVVPGDPVAMMIPPGASPDDIAGCTRSTASTARSRRSSRCGGAGGHRQFRHLHHHAPVTYRPDPLPPAGDAGAGGARDPDRGRAGRRPRARSARAVRGRAGEVVVDAFAGFALAVPDFLWGLAFIVAFGVLLPVLPISGRADPTQAIAASSGFYPDRIAGPPALRCGRRRARAHAHAGDRAGAAARRDDRAGAEGVARRGRWARTTSLLARVKGFSPLHVIVAEALRNAAIPTVSLTGVQFTFLVGGTVLIERIFSYPGIGNLAIDAVINRDLPLIQGLILTFAVLFILINLARRPLLRGCSTRGCAMAERRRLLRNWRVLLGGGLLLALTIAAVFAPLLAPHDPLDQDLPRSSCRPTGSSSAPTRARAGHRQSWPRHALAPDLGQPRRADGGAGGGRAHRPRRHRAGPRRGLLRRLARRAHLPPRRRLVLLSAGAARRSSWWP